MLQMLGIGRTGNGELLYFSPQTPRPQRQVFSLPRRNIACSPRSQRLRESRCGPHGLRIGSFLIKTCREHWNDSIVRYIIDINFRYKVYTVQTHIYCAKAAPVPLAASLTREIQASVARIQGKSCWDRLGQVGLPPTLDGGVTKVWTQSLLQMWQPCFTDKMGTKCGAHDSHPPLPCFDLCVLGRRIETILQLHFPCLTASKSQVQHGRESCSCGDWDEPLGCLNLPF